MYDVRFQILIFDSILIMRLLFIFCLLGCFQQFSAQSINPRQTGTLPAELSESSGLALGQGNSFWTHNDSGNEPILYQIDSTGKMLRQVRVRVPNIDWEDLAQDDNGNIYIADLGNNGNTRQNLGIYRISAASLAAGDTVSVDTINLRYAEQSSFPPRSSQLHFDVEALLWAGDSLHIFTKNRTNPFDGWVYHYMLPDQPGNYTVSRVDSFNTGGDFKEAYWIGAADVSKNGKRMILLSYDKMWVFSCYPGHSFLKGYGLEVGLFILTQKEGLVFKGDQRILLTDERFLVTGGRMYEADISGLPRIQVELGRDRMLAGDSVVLSPMMPQGTAFRWSTGDSTPSITVRDPGTYSVEVNLNGCIARDSVTVMGPNSAIEQAPPMHVEIGPNPFSNQINIQVNLPVAGPVQASLLDTSGKLVFSKTTVFVQAGKQRFSVMPTNLSPGSYQLVLRQNSYRVSGKLIKGVD
jgi:hypothetical protein